jgi:hypothetical protein
LRLGTVFFWFGVWVECYRGAPVAGSFGLKGQESSHNPGAREPDRLCFLAGREERFSFGQSLGRETTRIDEDWRNSISQRYAFS